MATVEQAKRLKASGYAVGDDAAKAYASSGEAGTTFAFLNKAWHGATLSGTSHLLDKVAPAAKPMMQYLEKDHEIASAVGGFAGSTVPFALAGAGGAAAAGAAGLVGWKAAASVIGARVAAGTVAGGMEAAAEASRYNHPLTHEQLYQSAGISGILATVGEGLHFGFMRAAPAIQRRFNGMLDGLVRRGWYNRVRVRQPRGPLPPEPPPPPPPPRESPDGSGLGVAAGDIKRNWPPPEPKQLGAGTPPAASTSSPAAAAEAAPKQLTPWQMEDAARNEAGFNKPAAAAEERFPKGTDTETPGKSYAGELDLSDLPPTFRDSSRPPPGYQSKGPYPEGHEYTGYEKDVNWWKKFAGPGMKRDGKVPSWYKTEAGQQWRQNKIRSKMTGGAPPELVGDGQEFAGILDGGAAAPPGETALARIGSDTGIGPSIPGGAGPTSGAAPGPRPFSAEPDLTGNAVNNTAAASGLGADPEGFMPPIDPNAPPPPPMPPPPPRPAPRYRYTSTRDNPLSAWGRILRNMGWLGVGTSWVPGIAGTPVGHAVHWGTGAAFGAGGALWGINSAFVGALNTRAMRQRILNNAIQPNMVRLGNTVRALCENTTPARTHAYYGHEDIDSAYHATTQAIPRALTDPMIVENHTRERYGPITEGNDRMHEGMVQLQLTSLKYLQEHIPKDPRAPSLDITPYDPPRADKVKFLKRVDAVNNPLETLKDPTAEDIKTIEATHPETLKNVRTQLLSATLDRKGKGQLSPDQARRASLTLGAPVNSGMNPGYISRLQGLVSQQPQQPQQAPGVMPQRGPARASRFTVNKNSAAAIAPGSQQNQVENAQ